MKKILEWTLGILLGVFILMRVYYALTDDFRMGNISYDMPYEKEWEVAALSSSEEQKLETILNQPYTYMSKGSQTYVFLSADGRYVLKFFKFKHLRPALFVEWLPPFGPFKEYQEKQRSRKKRKLFGIYSSYKLAYEVNKEDSGLVFVQLNHFGNKSRQVTLFDKLGIKHEVNLEHIPFVLQKRGKVFRDVLDELLQKGDVETAEKRIGQVFDMYVREYRKGIFDHDRGIMYNLGFVDDVPLHLDVGKLMVNEAISEPDVAKQDLASMGTKIKEWVQRYYPKEYDRLSRYIDNKIKSI